MNVDKQNFELVKSYYEICADTKTISEMGATPIFPHMALIENTLFPTTSNSTDSKNMAAALSFFINHGVETFVKVQVVQNPLDHDYNGIIISQPDLDANTAYTDIESLKAYQTTVTEIMSTVLGGPSSDGEYEQLVVEESQKGNFTLWSASKIESAVSSFIDFEMQLAAIKNMYVL
jgi:predicted metalloendopeptidase